MSKRKEKTPAELLSDLRINAKFKNRKQKEMALTIQENRITFVKGAAGTGKTFVALKTALECIKKDEFNIDQIVLTKPIVEITSSKGLGALPGDLEEKTLSYFMHFYDTLIKLVGNDATKELKGKEMIKETVLNYLRGSTFGKWDNNGKPVGSICIFDEAQNCSIGEMKSFISRMGEESKLVIMGDSDQIDLKLKNNEVCGLDDAWDRLQGLDGIGFVEFTEDDIVRDPFLIEIMKRYKED
jgi:phosphate starvation-inducible PhoH-like protein